MIGLSYASLLLSPLLALVLMGGAPAVSASPGQAADAATVSPSMCRPLTPPVSSDAEGEIVVADNFESGDLREWEVDTGGDGHAGVEPVVGVRGEPGCAARLRTSGQPGSVATMSVDVPEGSGQVHAQGWFNVAASGQAASPYFRFFSGSTRIAQVYRVSDNGQYWLQVLRGDGSYSHVRLTSRAIPADTWHHVQVAVLPAGQDTSVTAWLDGEQVYSDHGIDGPTQPITSVMLGDEHEGRLHDLLVDDVGITAAPVQDDPPCTAPTPTNTMPGQVLLADGFECGDLSLWTVRANGDGQARVTGEPVHSGQHAAALRVSQESGSMANLSAPLPAGTSAVSADGWFNVAQAGPDGNNVPFFRLFDGTDRVADVYRHNSNGQLWLRVTSPDGRYRYTRLTAGPLELHSWHRLQLRVVAAGEESVVEVHLDGRPVYSSHSLPLQASAITSVMLGSEHHRQAGSQTIDDIIIRSGS